MPSEFLVAAVQMNSGEAKADNYAKAGDISSLLKEKNNNLLSSRGNVTVDERTNTLNRGKTELIGLDRRPIIIHDSVKDEVVARPLLEINDLKTYFHTDRGIVKAIDGISLKALPPEDPAK